MLVSDESRAMLDVVRQYSRTWRLLLEYDEGRLAETPTHPVPPAGRLSLMEARVVVGHLRKALHQQGESSDLFGRERGDQLDAILAGIEQTFGDEPLYPTAQVRAAHLLYFVIKDHPFSDGNKRVGTLLFLEYLRRNGR